MTINFKNMNEMNDFIANGLPNFEANDLDSAFDAIQSEAKRIDAIRAIPTFSVIGLDF